jgi:hypothetical protein
MSINLVDAAKFYKELPHQQDALLWLQTQLSADTLEQFETKYRTVKKEPEATFPNTWDGVLAAAKKAGAKFPECVAAQWYLESVQGRHTACTHNYFGIKSKDGEGCYVTTTEFIGGKEVTIKDWFQRFDSLYACVEYLVTRWYKDFNGYKGVNRASTRNECAKLLKEEGYATDIGYTTKLIQIMDRQLQTPDPKTPGVVDKRILAVPYEYQLDNQSGTGYRECFSSTCAMIAKYYGKVKNDDEYNKIRSKYGDSTDNQAQLAALKALGLKAKFVTDGNAALLENEIRNGRPVAVGWLHKGPSSSPSGGGHWTCCVGFTPNSFVFNDPNGEADMVNGGYISNSPDKGKGVEYSKKNWLKRWECDGKNTGWAILVNE